MPLEQEVDFPDDEFGEVIPEINIHKLSDKPKRRSKIVNKTDIVKLHPSCGKTEDIADNCFVDYVTGAFFPKNDPRVHKDCITDTYIIVDGERLVKKHVFAVASGIDVYGNFNDIQYTANNIPNSIICFKTLNESIFIKSDLPQTSRYFNEFYKEDIESGNFYHVSLKSMIKTQIGPKVAGTQYSLRNNFSTLCKNIPNTYIKTLGKQYTWGVEIETISGNMPERLAYDIAYKAVHDGSLRHKDDNKVWGAEYVTDVFKGDLGLLQLKKLCNELTKRTIINYQCSNHFHIGGVNFSKENVVLMYWLYTNIQNEVYSLIPLSRRMGPYCKKLKDLKINIGNIHPKNIDRDYYINYYYNSIISYVSSGFGGNSNEINKKKQHPLGPKCNYNHGTPRYCWVNFVPTLWDTRGFFKNKSYFDKKTVKNTQTHWYSIEFRMASATLSYKKNKMWLLLCMSFVDIVENHKHILYSNSPIDLQTIIETCYRSKGVELQEFVRLRKMLYNSDDPFVNSQAELEDYKDNEYDPIISIKSI